MKSSCFYSIFGLFPVFCWFCFCCRYPCNDHLPANIFLLLLKNCPKVSCVQASSTMPAGTQRLNEVVEWMGQRAFWNLSELESHWYSGFQAVENFSPFPHVKEANFENHHFMVREGGSGLSCSRSECRATFYPRTWDSGQRSFSASSCMAHG